MCVRPGPVANGDIFDARMASQAASRRQTVGALAIALLTAIALLIASQLALGWMSQEPLHRTASVVAGLVAAIQVLVLLLSARTAPIDLAGQAQDGQCLVVARAGCAA